MIDPDWTAEGRDAFVAAVAAAREKLGDLPLRLVEVVLAPHDVALFAWELGDTPVIAAGFGTIAVAEGHIEQACNFFAAAVPS